MMSVRAGNGFPGPDHGFSKLQSLMFPKQFQHLHYTSSYHPESHLTDRPLCQGDGTVDEHWSSVNPNPPKCLEKGQPCHFLR